MAPPISTYRLQIAILGVGRYAVAVARIGGIELKGRMMGDPASALRELFRELAAPAQNVDALMAVELMVAGDDYQVMRETVEDVLDGSGRGHDRLPPARRLPELPAQRAGQTLQSGPGDQEHDQQHAGDQEHATAEDLPG